MEKVNRIDVKFADSDTQYTTTFEGTPESFVLALDIIKDVILRKGYMLSIQDIYNLRTR